MADDINVEIGPIDLKKVPKDNQAKAKSVLGDGMTKAIKGASGFTCDKKTPGYKISLTVAEMTVDAKGASCKVNAVLSKFPKDAYFAGASSSAKVSGGGKPDALVADCLGGAVEDIMKKSIAAMKKAGLDP